MKPSVDKKRESLTKKQNIKNHMLEKMSLILKNDTLTFARTAANTGLHSPVPEEQDMLNSFLTDVFDTERK
jgi:hypothetical protein